MKNTYIVLSQTGTLFSRLLRWYTKAPYNHVSIAFDSSITDMYSFGRKQRYNIFDNGLIKESFHKGLFPCFPNAVCCILEIPVTDTEYEAMCKTVNLFCCNQENYHYNLIGVLGCVMGIELSRKDHFFCSQFVSYIMSSAAFWHSAPEFTKPMDFLGIPNKRLVFEGDIKKFI